jgi:site-specific DNA-methyltransferase (cytosine-N4-specific)
MPLRSPRHAPLKWITQLRLGAIRPYYQTELGGAYHIDAIELLRSIPSSSIDLVMTSPPFVLIRKKDHGKGPTARHLPCFVHPEVAAQRTVRRTCASLHGIGGTCVSGAIAALLRRREAGGRHKRLDPARRDG